MEFALNAEQKLLQESLKGFLAAEWTLDDVKAFAAGEAARGDKLESGLDAFGLNGLLLPESAGGLGLGLLDAVIAQEQIGFAVAPSNFMAAALFAIAAPVLANSRVRAGVSSALGQKADAQFVIAPPEATHLLYTHGSSALRIIAWPGGDPLHTIDRTRTVFNVAVRGDAKPLASSDQASRILAIAHLLTAADTLGAAQAMLDKAVAYAADRKQFGRVIGSFQAVKHMCAEMAAKLEPARALVWHAAYALDTNDPEALIMAHLAKAHLSEIGTFIARTSTEVYGGMGFTDLVGLHYWYKRIGANRQLFGSPAAARETAARLQGLVA